jgi:hypothetical protein
MINQHQPSITSQSSVFFSQNKSVPATSRMNKTDSSKSLNGNVQSRDYS